VPAAGAADRESGKLFRLRALRIPVGANAPAIRVPRARSAPAGRFAPAGRGADLCRSQACRFAGQRPEPAGETRVVFADPARTGALADAWYLWQGPSPLPQCCAGIRTSRWPKPPASARPAPGGRWPFVVPGPTGLRGTVAHGRGKCGSRFPRPDWQPLFTDRKHLRARQAAGLLLGTLSGGQRACPVRRNHIPVRPVGARCDGSKQRGPEAAERARLRPVSPLRRCPKGDAGVRHTRCNGHSTNSARA
jgi:hypothetical protein